MNKIPWPINLNSVVTSIERKLIKEALNICGGNSQRAAALLGMNRTTLLAKRKKYGLPVGPPNRSPGWERIQ